MENDAGRAEPASTRDDGHDPDDRGWARDGAGPKRRRRLTPFKLAYAGFVASVAAYFTVTVLLGVVDPILVRRYGTPGTFEVSECVERRGYRTAPYLKCRASFTGDDGSRRESVWIHSYRSEAEAPTRTGHLRNGHGVTDDINLFTWLGPKLIFVIVPALVGWYLIRYYLGYEDHPGFEDDSRARRRRRRSEATKEGWSSW